MAEIPCQTFFKSSKIFLRYNISIKATKSYFNYLNIVFLDQQVNFLGLTTSDKKLKAMCLLQYPEILRALEYYLGLTDYQKSYIYFYA